MTTQDRFHALDAARAFALLLGIVLHATMSFFLVIPAQDVSQSTTLGVTFYVIHMFRMSLFYFIAGFFAHLVFHRRGARAFVKDRAKRILVPMTAGWVVLAPPTIAAVIWGLTRTFPDGPPAGVDASAAPQGFPLTHLWFLYYLSIFYVLALALRAAFVTLVDRSGALRARIDRLIGVGARELPRAARARGADLRGALHDGRLARLVRHPDARHGLHAENPGARRLRHGVRVRLDPASASGRARRAREAVAREPGARRGPHERVPRDGRHRAELDRGHRGRGRRRHARRLRGLLHGSDLVLVVRLDRRGDALLLAAERAAPLPRRLVVLALSRPPADRVRSAGGC